MKLKQNVNEIWQLLLVQLRFSKHIEEVKLLFVGNIYVFKATFPPNSAEITEIYMHRLSLWPLGIISSLANVSN